MVAARYREIPRKLRAPTREPDNLRHKPARPEPVEQIPRDHSQVSPLGREPMKPGFSEMKVGQEQDAHIILNE